MKPSELLTAAKAVIADPKHWTQNAFARDAAGNSACAANPGAVCFCALGAMDRAASNSLHLTNWSVKADAELHLRHAAVSIRRDYGPAGINDDTDHPTVMKMFDTAIELAKRVEGTV